MVGRNNDPDIIGDFCDKCHEAQHERLRISGVSMKTPDNSLEATIQVWKGLGISFDSFSIACFRRAQELEQDVRKLDQHCPEWRRVLRLK